MPIHHPNHHDGPVVHAPSSGSSVSSRASPPAVSACRADGRIPNWPREALCRHARRTRDPDGRCAEASGKQPPREQRAQPILHPGTHVLGERAPAVSSSDQTPRREPASLLPPHEARQRHTTIRPARPHRPSLPPEEVQKNHGAVQRSGSGDPTNRHESPPTPLPRRRSFMSQHRGTDPE